MNELIRQLAGPHMTARTERPPSYPNRFPVPDDKVSWAVPFPEYAPPYHVEDVVLANDQSVNPRGWADPEDLDRVTRAFHSLEGTVQFDASGRPLNPRGRTGVRGRGLLGKWGANFAADPLLTRRNPTTGAVEILLIRRRDSGILALPGGMVDAGESSIAAMSRELREETGVEADMTAAKVVYRGYVDGRRNTDNSWLETVVGHLHFPDGFTATPTAGDDASEALWEPVAPGLFGRMHGTHGRVVRLAMELVGLAGGLTCPG